MIHKNITGWNNHRNFGLRQEWLELCLAEPDTWPQANMLGNRQVMSLRVWLKTAGLVDHQGRQTPLWELFRQEGTGFLPAWEKLWVNVVFNFPTARWYVTHRGLGSWTVRELHTWLQRDVPHLASRTAYNALLELVGLLERTPVGHKLGQGEVAPGRSRLVTRQGYPRPSGAAVNLALERLFQEQHRGKLSLANEGLLWPWVIFGCPKPVILSQLLLNKRGEFLLAEQHVIRVPEEERTG